MVEVYDNDKIIRYLISYIKLLPYVKVDDRSINRIMISDSNL